MLANNASTSSLNVSASSSKGLSLVPGFTKKMWAELSSSASGKDSASSLYRVQSATRSSVSLSATSGRKASLKMLMMKGRKKISNKKKNVLIGSDSAAAVDEEVTTEEEDMSMSEDEESVGRPSISSEPADVVAHPMKMESAEPAVDIVEKDQEMAAVSPRSVSSSIVPMTLAPRPFPPESLAEVPEEYIKQQMRDLASEYWQDQETIDCTIIVPIPYMDEHGHVLDISAEVPGTSGKVFGVAGRRFTEPLMSSVQPRLTFELHRDYMSGNSTYLRSLFSGAHPVDLINSASANPCAIPADRRPRLLPSSPDHPILLLPVPDPSSIHLLFRYMYFGEIDHIREALWNRTADWEGVARNVEYLGLDIELKMFLRAYYNRWLDPERLQAETEGSSDEESDEEYFSGSDMDTDDTASEADDERNESSQDMFTDKHTNECEADERGRSRKVRSLIV